MSKRSYQQVFWNLAHIQERSVIHLYRQRASGTPIPIGFKTLCGEPIPRNARQTRSKIKGGVVCENCMLRKTMKSNPLANPVKGAWVATRAEINAAIAHFERRGGKIQVLPPMGYQRIHEALSTKPHMVPASGFQEFAWE